MTEKAHLSIVICGHVDSGKSTTTGRLLFELGGIPERELQKLQATADALGKGSFAFAFYMDTQAAERERGITIACTTKKFECEKYSYTVIDAPGHRDFIKNMITGAAQADCAVLMVPADGNFPTSIQKGNHKAAEVPGQTRQHSRLINLLGVKTVICGINKMDCSVAQYSEERYTEIRNEMANMLVKTGWKKAFVQTGVPYLPISGWIGDNLVKKSDKMPWYTGCKVTTTIDGKATEMNVHTLYDALNNFVQPPVRKNDAPMRMPVSAFYKIKGVGDVCAGRIEQGIVQVNREVAFVPTHTASNPCTGKIFSIEMHHTKLECGMTGDNVGINIKGISTTNPPKTGDIMIYLDEKKLKAVDTFTAVVQIMDVPNEIHCGYTPIAYVRCAHSACRIVKINWRNGKETGNVQVENPTAIKANETAEVVFKPEKPFTCDTFSSCEGLGRIAFLEGHSAIMLGRIVKVEFKEGK